MDKLFAFPTVILLNNWRLRLSLKNVPLSWKLTLLKTKSKDAESIASFKSFAPGLEGTKSKLQFSNPSLKVFTSHS